MKLVATSLTATGSVQPGKLTEYVRILLPVGRGTTTISELQSNPIRQAQLCEEIASAIQMGREVHISGEFRT